MSQFLLHESAGEQLSQTITDLKQKCLPRTRKWYFSVQSSASELKAVGNVS